MKISSISRMNPIAVKANVKRHRRQAHHKLSHVEEFQSNASPSWLSLLGSSVIAAAEERWEDKDSQSRTGTEGRKIEGFHMLSSGLNDLGQRELFLSDVANGFVLSLEEKEEGTYYFSRSNGTRLGEIVVTEVFVSNSGMMRVATNSKLVRPQVLSSLN